jgi:hypothetical protein
MSPQAWIGVAILGMVAIVVLSWVRRSRARHRNEADVDRDLLARARGWTFTPEDPTLLERWPDAFGDLGPFEPHAKNRRTFGVLRGATADHEFIAFGYERRMRVAGRRDPIDVLSTVWVVPLPVALPSIDARPGGRMQQWMASKLESPTIVIECADEWVRAALYQPEVIELTHALGDGGWCVRGTDLIAMRGSDSGRPASNDELVDTTELLTRLASVLPLSSRD